MAKQKGLGKGLGALLGEESLRADTPAEGAVSTLPLQKIEPNPLQPRKTLPRRSWTRWPSPSASTASSSH